MKKTAEQIMRKKAFIKAELDRQFTHVQSDTLWKEATAKLQSMLDRYADIPQGVHMHTDSFIFPAAAIYLTAKERLGETTAYRIIENAAVRNSVSAGKKLAVLMRIPGMRSLFINIWNPMTRKMFGAENGFQNVFYPQKRREYRMDITACPYCRYLTELGCPELTKIFCENDERVYGNLPGLAFVRAGTLGKGADRCDFCIRKV